MSNPQYTRKANRVIALQRKGVTEGSGWTGTSDDPHPPVGNERGTTRMARVEVRFPEPSNWPSTGRLISAHLSMHESGTTAHPGYDGGNPRASVRRINETPNGHDPSSTGGTAKEWSVNGPETHDVTDMVEEMLPSRIKRRSDPTQGCGNRPYGWFQIRSSDEANDWRSFIMTDDLWLTVEIKTAVTPDAPGIIEVVGAQAGTDSPTIVGSTDGQTLAVRFAYRGAAGDTCAKAELALHGIGATDDTPGAVIATTGNIAPSSGGAAGVYSIKLTGLTLGVAGRFRIRTTSQKGEQGDWSSLDDGYVQMATIPGPPLDIVFQPFASSPHILFSLNSPDPADYITNAEAEVTYVPQGTSAVILDQQVGGTTRRADLDTGVEFAPGQDVSYRVRTTNRDGVVGQWSAPARQTMREAQAVTFSPGPGRLTSLTPTITILFPSADGARLRLLDPTDDAKVLWDSGATVLVDQTSHAFAVPAGKLAYGQSFRAVGSYVPNGGGTTYLAESEPVTYTIASLPTVVLSVPEAVGGKVGTQTPSWVRTVTDPDGAAVGLILQGFYAGATPKGTGAFLHQFVSGPYNGVIPGLVIPWETSIDSVAKVTNDIDVQASTTLNGALSVGATGCTLASGAGFVTGMVLVIQSAVSGQAEARVSTIAGTSATWVVPLEHAHGNGNAVTARVFGPLSPWLTITALQPPDVDLLSPPDGATINDPTATLDWSVTGYGGRTQAAAQVDIYQWDPDLNLIASLTVGSETSVDVPAWLLANGRGTRWVVTVVDTQGMISTPAARVFVSSFAEPVGVTSVVLEPDPESGTVVVSWNDSLEPYLDHYEVTWLNDAGEPVRIDGGPESLLDGNPPFTGTSLTHLGARLGDNVYYVSASNGWRSSDPVSASTTLDRPDARAWELVDQTGTAWGLIVTGASIAHAGTIERYQPPGGQSRQVTWGSEARHLPVTIETVPSEDGEFVSVLRSWMAAGTPVWVKGPAPYLLDPLWATLQGFTPAPESWGGMSIDLDWLELGDPVHAILPPAPEPPPAGEGDIYATADTLDWGTVLET